MDRSEHSPGEAGRAFRSGALLGSLVVIAALLGVAVLCYLVAAVTS